MTMPMLGLETPVGPLSVSEKAGAIFAVSWGMPTTPGETPLLGRAARQLSDYFTGRRRDFDLPLAPEGTAFQQRVWAEMSRIPPGQTVSYGELARRLGTAPRAVGGACRTNPIPIFIPCHRVLAGDGNLGGYSGGEGLDTKRFLLALEGNLTADLWSR